MDLGDKDTRESGLGARGGGEPRAGSQKTWVLLRSGPSPGHLLVGRRAGGGAWLVQIHSSGGGTKNACSLPPRAEGEGGNELKMEMIPRC